MDVTVFVALLCVSLAKDILILMLQFAFDTAVHNCLAGDILLIWNPWKITSKVKCTKKGKVPHLTRVFCVPPWPLCCGHISLLVVEFTSSFSVQIETAQGGAIHPGWGRESCRYGLLHTSKNSWSENTASGRGHELAAHFNSGLINWTLLKSDCSTSGCHHNQKALPFYILGNLMYNMYSTYVNIESMYRTVCNLTKF